MHKLNILIYGTESFKTTFNELKPYLKFNLTSNKKKLSDTPSDYDGIICFDENLNKNEKDEIRKKNCFKVLATLEPINNDKFFDYILKLPTSVKELNNLIENIVAKEKFSKNSSIKIKSYLLDKNEKKLSHKNKFVILTEKEIQLLELFLRNPKPMSKSEILSLVWKYSSDADTHTVETHIYRLRKKINNKFMDEEFILNSKDGYHL